MEPGQQAGRHLHPCAVVGYIVEGTAGSAFYEPADTIIANFGDASDLEPMTFVALYLLDGEQDPFRMLN
jgi:hypothetical protein